MSNYSNHKKGIKISESDGELLNVLHKVDFLCSFHAALIIGENVEYTDKRLKDLAKAGLVKRKVLKANCPCANWITKKVSRKPDYHREMYVHRLSVDMNTHLE